MKRVILLILLLSTSNIVYAQSENLDIYITELSVSPAEDIPDAEVSFLVSAKIVVVNRANHIVEFRHADLCEFKLAIKTDIEGVNGRYPYGCAEAIKTVKFDPGMTNTTAIGGISVENGTDELPDGDYHVSVQLADFQKENIGNLYNATFQVQDHQLSDVNYNATTFDTGPLPIADRLNFSLFFILSILIIPILRRMKY